jgi:hypothetical protein
MMLLAWAACEHYKLHTAGDDDEKTKSKDGTHADLVLELHLKSRDHSDR